ncbi:hypothetical protein NP493_537g00032 [Ridgeia piscesae]|uniref:Coiled-coil domain-containing protein n=1 Tax=Ridgeia piscesae TaxID=27915 RepID=A0AAD9KXB3_RIDPI|nr:hypothetical protein NP493_537g00032 [Ridgeia piscesae]
MPKKFKGENSKAVQARQRKESARLEEKDRKQKELEDEYWRDDDKHAVNKQNRKEERERKRLEQLERKKEAQKLLTEEIASIHTIKPPAAAKLTRAEIQAQQERMAAAVAAAKKSTEVLHNELPLEENINREIIEEGARGVDEAITLLSVKDPITEKHPEKRVKAAYTAFEEVNLPRLKAENPNLRLSQLKQMLKKDWMKSPDNPMNQRTMAFNKKQ